MFIYDKKLQFEQSGVFASNCPYKWGEALPRSWIRIEIECKTKWAVSVMNSVSSFSEIFRFIFDNYAQKEVEKRYPNARDVVWRGIYKHWLALFDWNKLHCVIQKSNFVQLRDAFVEACGYVFNQCSGKINLVRSVIGDDSFISQLNSDLKSRQLSSIKTDNRWCRKFENMALEVRDQIFSAAQESSLLMDVQCGTHIPPGHLLPYLVRDPDASIFYIKGSEDHCKMLFRKLNEFLHNAQKDGVKQIALVDLSHILLNYGIDG